MKKEKLFKKNKSKIMKNNNGKPKANWILKVIILAFGLSVFFSLGSEILMSRVNIIISFIILVGIIFIGILFDIIGTAVTSADEAPFHAMAADKVKGGREGVRLIRNADVVSNFCNDVIGDICGIISGSAGAAIVLKIFISKGGIKETLTSIIISGIISTVTVGGKALGKTFAINNSKEIVYKVAYIACLLNEKFGIDLIPKSCPRKKV
ncbi:hypothetical protein [Thermovenabulum gondwanense]|uniref:CNNM transmembrane domain-containing protein n=1 Tax=Thermovenabulum gondwanense TaxID=520767 RepID=A0A162MGP5_9FIRM|nr:hypothetical protein [Thermovenabulum gondwanense]KYO65812.1 hypothetical protein ATZ99_14500 [Thermovenabulum gondwanense]